MLILLRTTSLPFHVAFLTPFTCSSNSSLLSSPLPSSTRCRSSLGLQTAVFANIHIDPRAFIQQACPFIIHTLSIIYHVLLLSGLCLRRFRRFNSLGVRSSNQGALSREDFLKWGSNKVTGSIEPFCERMGEYDCGGFSSAEIFCDGEVVGRNVFGCRA